MEEDYSDLDEEDMAMFIRKFKKLFKKAKENSTKKNFSKPRNSDREQFFGCFKCGKHHHIVKNCPLLKKNKRYNSSENKAENSSARRFSKAMLATWGDTTEDDEASEEEEAVVALMARSESDSDNELLESLRPTQETGKWF